MYSIISRFLADMAEETARGEVDRVFARFAFPTIIYIIDKILVVSTPEQLGALLKSRAAELDRCGVQRKELSVTAVSLERDGRILAHVSATYHGKDGTLRGEGKAKYYFRRDGETLKIEMVELCSFPEMEGGFGGPILNVAQ